MVMENNKKLIRLLSDAICNLSLAMPLLEQLQGKIPSEILDLLDYANKLTVKY